MARLIDQQKEEESMGQGRWVRVEDRLPAKGVYARSVSPFVWFYIFVAAFVQVFHML